MSLGTLPLALAALFGAVTPAAAAAIAPAEAGRVQFQRYCAGCHFSGGTGTFMLNRRLGNSRGLLEGRIDLQPAYIQYVVRHGLQSMPWISRVEVTDAALDSIAAYLTSNPSGQAQPK